MQFHAIISRQKQMKNNEKIIIITSSIQFPHPVR